MQDGKTTHPPYMTIWFVLAVLMAGKVAVSMSPLPDEVAVIVLVIISLVSAFLVAMYYMHLRFENKRLWLLAFIPFPLIAILILTVIQEW